MKRQVLFSLTLIVFNAVSHSQSGIKEAEESLKKTEKNHSETTNNNQNNHDSEYNFLTEVVGQFFIEILAYTAYGIAIESPFEMEHKSSNALLTKHPYTNTNTGNYSYTWNEDSKTFTTSISNRFIFETNRVYGNHLNVNMRFLKRFGLEIDYLQLWEENTNFDNNTLAIYTVLAKYNRVRTERFNAYWGLGAAYVDGDVDELGFTYGLGAELFFMKPFSIESNFNQTLINSNSIDKFNALLNYHRKQYKFTLGYEHLKIGDVGISNFTAGIGVSF